MENSMNDADPTHRKLVHDLRNSFFALRTGIDLLPDLREDASRFEEIHRILQSEINTASQLLSKLVDQP